MDQPVKIADWNSLADRTPAHALVSNTDLVVVRYDDDVSVLYGRCLHRGALMADGHVDGDNLICGVHGWDFRYDTGVSEYDNKEALHKFTAEIRDDAVWVDQAEIEQFEVIHPQPFDRSQYLGSFQATHPHPSEEPNSTIQMLARDGLDKVGHHGPGAAMGVPRRELPQWDDLQVLTAQLSRLPRLDNEPVRTAITIGPASQKPLELDIPLFVTDMSFGALSAEAKVALARGAEMAGTGICSGEGGMLPEEQQENSRYLFELGPAKFGFDMELMPRVQAFHFKFGQGAKTGTGGHLPGSKNQGKISEVRGVEPGTTVISPPRIAEFTGVSDYRALADEVRDASGGVPIGAKLSAQHIEADIDAALEIGVDYIILDGRGGGTGSAPLIFRDHISVPTIPALARARRHLDKCGYAKGGDVTLIVTGGLRTAPDFVKAMALGADGIAVANSALQAIGCIAMRACHTNNCPVGIATQKQKLRDRLDVQMSARRLERFFTASVDLMKVLARACGYDDLSGFAVADLSTWKKEMAELSGVAFAGVSQ